MMKRLVVIAVLAVVSAGIVGYVWWPSGQLRGSDSSAKSSTRGFLRKVYVDEHGREHKYLVFLPYDYRPGQKRPLLLFINGKGENGDDGLKTISNNFGIELWEMKRHFPFVSAIPQCPKGARWDAGQFKKAIGIMDEVAKEYGTDPERTYVTGVSSGGSGVWNIITAYPHRFAAAVPLCGIPDSDGPLEAMVNLPIWNFYNDEDKEDLVAANRQMRKSLLAAGASPIFTEYKAKRHDCWNRAYRSAGMFEWLLEQNRSSNARQSGRFKLLPTSELLDLWKSRGASGWVIDEDEALVEKGPASEPPGSLVSNEAYDACEFHLDLFLESEDSRGRLGLLEDGGGKEGGGAGDGYTLTLCLADAGTADLRHSSGGRIASLDPAAQRQLRAGSWNDVRVRFGKGRIGVRINGWKGIDAAVQGNNSEGNRTRPLRPAIIATGSGSGARWRNVRLRAADTAR